MENNVKTGDIYVCKTDFEVCGATLLEKVTIKEGTEFKALYKNRTHVGLDNGNDKTLILAHHLFNKYFEKKP